MEVKKEFFYILINFSAKTFFFSIDIKILLKDFQLLESV